MGDMKDDLFGKVTSDMDLFKKIASKIPGFSGYIERQARRDADKLLRVTLSDRFRELEGRVSGLQRDFISQGEIAYVDDTCALLRFDNIYLALVIPGQHPAHIALEHEDAETFGPLVKHRDGTESIYIEDSEGNTLELMGPVETQLTVNNVVNNYNE